MNNGGGSAGLDDMSVRRPQLMEWAIGKGYDLFREGTGKLLLPGEKISWDQHLHAVGEEITSGSEIGIWLYPKGQEPKKRSYLIAFTGLRKREYLDIPPNTVAHTEGFTVLKENTLITNFQPHFHLRGKAMQVEAILPDGSTQIVSYVGRFNFNWMTNYIYEDDASPVFPKGTVIHVTAWHDNTRANPFNPDPDQWVGYGDRTVDEMAHAWMNVVYLTDEEYNALLAERKAGAVARRSSVRPGNGAAAVVARLYRGCPRSSAGALRRGSATAKRAPARLWRQRNGCIRGVVPQPGRQPHVSRRISEQERRSGARRSDRAEQPNRARRSGPRDSRRTFSRAGATECSPSSCPRTSPRLSSG